jgi:hypothetical protein
VKRRALLFLFLIVGIVGVLIGAIWMLMSIIFAPDGTRAWNIALAFDRLGNATTGGDGKETISSRAGRLMAERGWACYLCKFLDWLKKEHCKTSIGT